MTPRRRQFVLRQVSPVPLECREHAFALGQPPKRIAVLRWSDRATVDDVRSLDGVARRLVDAEPSLLVVVAPERVTVDLYEVLPSYEGVLTETAPERYRR